jgi:pyridoxal 5'-phosphate synthase / NAD(P)H-hydrate epimerase
VTLTDCNAGWDVENGDVSQLGIAMPHVLVSLTAPKLCAKHFTGPHHYLGGRFLPPAMAQKYGLSDLPPFPGTAQCVRLEATSLTSSSKKAKAAEKDACL